MKIYKSELEAGIAELIEANASIAYSMPIEGFKVAEATATDELQKQINLMIGYVDSELFYPTKSVLATSSWNKNDDVFSPIEMWRARKSPIHTFTDIEHDHDQIVGHITGTWAIDENGNLISEDTAEANLPEMYHLCNSALVYRFPRGRSAKAIERAENLIASIEKGEKFVSMECVFPGFNYAVISPENKYSIIERNETTAFLTKYLRVYGGDGVYNGYKIGRLLKGLLFSGKGYVDKPANPQSIIFDKDCVFSFSKSNYQDKWFDVSDKKIFNIPLEVENVVAKINDDTENNSMANEEMQKQIDELKAAKADLEAKLADANVKKLQEQIVELNATLEAKSSELATVSQKLADEAVAALKAVEESKAAVQENIELKEKLAKAELDKVTSQRISKLVEGGIARQDAEAKVTKFVNLNDDQFEEVAAALIEVAKPKEDAAAGELETVLEGAEPNAGEGAGSVEDNTDDKEAEVASLRLSIGRLLSAKFPTAIVNGEE